MAKVFLVILFLWVTGIHLLLLSCDPESADSALLSVNSWRGKVTSGCGILSAAWLTAASASQHLAKSQNQLCLPPPLVLQWMPEDQSREWWVTVTALWLDQTETEYQSCDCSVLSLRADVGELQHHSECVGLFFFISPYFSFKVLLNSVILK